MPGPRREPHANDNEQITVDLEDTADVLPSRERPILRREVDPDEQARVASIFDEIDE